MRLICFFFFLSWGVIVWAGLGEGFVLVFCFYNIYLISKCVLISILSFLCFIKM